MPIELAEEDGLCDTQPSTLARSDLDFAHTIAQLSSVLSQPIVTLPVEAENFAQHVEAYLDVIDAGAIVPVTLEGRRYVAISETQLRAIWHSDDVDAILGSAKPMDNLLKPAPCSASASA